MHDDAAYMQPYLQESDRPKTRQICSPLHLSALIIDRVNLVARGLPGAF